MTGRGGLHCISAMASRLQLPRMLTDAMHVKKRRRGCDDTGSLLALIYSLACGDGALSDLDAFRQDTVTLTIVGMDRAPASRRMGGYLARCTSTDIEAMPGVARQVTGQVLPAASNHEIATRGYVPVFIDGSEIEVTGRYYEGANRGYSGRLLYCLHGIFVGGVWASHRLCPGGTDVVAGWCEQLESDVRPVLDAMRITDVNDGSADTSVVEQTRPVPVGVSTDNAWYRKECVA